MLTGIEAIQQRVVVRDDLFEAERAGVCGHMAVAGGWL